MFDQDLIRSNVRVSLWGDDQSRRDAGGCYTKAGIAATLAARADGGWTCSNKEYSLKQLDVRLQSCLASRKHDNTTECSVFSAVAPCSGL